MIMPFRTVHWLVEGVLSGSNWLAEYPSASIRLRAGVAQDCLLKHGWISTAGECVQDTPQIMVIEKIGAGDIERRQLEWGRQIRESKSRGSLILVDYTDHHLGFESPMSLFYRDVLKVADVAVVPSGSMKKLLEMHWPGRIEVIEDAIEFRPIAPKAELHRPVTMLWFGHASNISFLADFIRNKVPTRGRYGLLALTNEAGANLLRTQNFLVPPNLDAKFIPWSVKAMIEASKQTDLCVIPSDVVDPKKMGVSANRLVTALALGLPVAAENLSSYLEFRDYYVDINSEKFAELLDNPLAFSDQVQRAQKEVVPKFERDVVGEKWKTLFDSLISPHSMH